MSCVCIACVCVRLTEFEVLAQNLGVELKLSIMPTENQQNARPRGVSVDMGGKHDGAGVQEST